MILAYFLLSNNLFVHHLHTMKMTFFIVISNWHVKGSKFGRKIYKFGVKSFKKLYSTEFMELVFSKSDVGRCDIMSKSKLIRINKTVDESVSLLISIPNHG